MKKSLIIVFILLIISITVIYGAHSQIDSVKDQVIIKENVLFGDKKNAEGITVTSRVHYDNHLFWDTMYTIRDELDIKTNFTFSQSRRNEDYIHKSQISLYPNLNFSMSSSGAIDLENEMQFPNKPIIDVASRTKDGETHEETVAFRDYYEYYPLTLDVSYDFPVDPMYNCKETDYGKYFKIPVPPEHTVKISITKNEAGGINDISCNSLKNEVGIYTSGVLTDNGCYIAITVTKSYNNNKSLKLPQGILGIHYLPFQELKPSAIRRNIDIENASLVYPLDSEKCQILQLKKSKDDSKLLMFTRENDEVMLSVIDINTMELLQKINIHKSKQPGICAIKQYDDFLVVTFDNNEFCLLTFDKGVYKIELSDSFNSSGNTIQDINYNDMVFDFDGERMAAATYIDKYQFSSDYLLVFDKTGLTYIGEYSNSLDNTDDSSQFIRPLFEVNSLNVNFN